MCIHVGIVSLLFLLKAFSQSFVLIEFLPSVDALVRNKMSDPVEGFLTVFVFIEFLSSVYSLVHHKARDVSEKFSTLFTLMKFVSNVKSHVDFGDDCGLDVFLL